jgi:hypothetical protein
LCQVGNGSGSGSGSGSASLHNSPEPIHSHVTAHSVPPHRPYPSTSQCECTKNSQLLPCQSNVAPFAAVAVSVSRPRTGCKRERGAQYLCQRAEPYSPTLGELLGEALALRDETDESNER